MIGNFFSKNKQDNFPYSKDGRPMRYATFTDRNMAGMIDFIILTFIFLPINNTLEWIFKIDHKRTSDEYQERIEEISQLTQEEQLREVWNLLSNMYSTESIIILLILSACTIGVFCYFWCKYQSTPGGMFMSLRVVDAKTFDRATNGQYIIRGVVSMISSVFLFLGFVSIIFSKKKQAWHDYAANTIVVTLGKPLK